ncbi:pyridoxal-phosphate dependent enzyme [Chitinophaga flava]|uniref:2,3-diaminopropionate biosynthesis protein SbnA n=1 Tax=Chitinophaga flava TaxID=2259036 RepID=A0A365XVU2_9BACT|nr:pyridoxal-phosphate dependent enzyme [Chitinophaga flava]RBL90131.1 2,3-diaminopropionate biosynthesis protein SbnA [Chitinophaga flava]
MLQQLENLSAFIGNTPLISLRNTDTPLWAKLEYNNFSGSSKDRAGYSIIYNGIKSGRINQDTTIIASSSGNLAIAVASICKMLDLKFIPVIDPNINAAYENLLNLLAYKVVKITERDHTGGYLLTRIDTVNKMHATINNSFIADQYGDPNNYKGYYGLTNEILACPKPIDYIFVAVSSSGAITGISKSIKEKRPEIKIVGVDVEGSVIFNAPPVKRYISGIGASQVPPIIKNALIDDVVILSQTDIIKGCLELLNEQVIFAGASSGAVYLAAKNYFRDISYTTTPNSLLIFPDKGHSYLDTIYNKEWATQLANKLQSASIA